MLLDEVSDPQWPILCLNQRIAKGREENSSVVVSTSRLQVLTDQDPLRERSAVQRMVQALQKLKSVGLWMSGVATPTSVRRSGDAARDMVKLKLMFGLFIN